MQHEESISSKAIQVIKGVFFIIIILLSSVDNACTKYTIDGGSNWFLVPVTKEVLYYQQ